MIPASATAQLDIRIHHGDTKDSVSIFKGDQFVPPGHITLVLCKHDYYYNSCVSVT